MKIFKEKAKVISEKPMWVCFHSGYMYTGDTLFHLLYQMLTEWNYDKHLVG